MLLWAVGIAFCPSASLGFKHPLFIAMQVFRRKGYRFIYPAGLISLALLPLLGYLYLERNGFLKPKAVLQIVMGFNCYDPRPTASLRHFKTITIGDDKDETGKILAENQKLIRDLISRKDRLNGFRFIFHKEAKYSSLVYILNICLLEGASYYYDNESIWVAYSTVNSLVMKNNKLVDYYLIEENPTVSFSETIRKELTEFSGSVNAAKSYWLAGILYLIMVGLTVQKVGKQLRKPKPWKLINSYSIYKNLPPAFKPPKVYNLSVIMVSLTTQKVRHFRKPTIQPFNN